MNDCSNIMNEWMQRRMSIYEGTKKKIELKDILWIDNDSEFVVGRLFFLSWKHIVADLSEH